MTIVIAIQFLTGRYHATPWDKQVNEGVVEWPPSPWRILRSLVSAYYRLPERPDRSAMLQLMTQLTEQTPSYCLPAYTAAHTRHFMPLWKEGKSTTTKVLDTFYALPGGAMSEQAAVQVVWPELSLAAEAITLLRQLCAQVGYLGRAESWVEMQVANSAKEINARPIASESDAKNQEQVVKVLVPLNADGMLGLIAALEVLPKPKKGKGAWSAPGDVLDGLELDVGKLHSQGWHGIPGSRWTLYALEPVRSPLAVRSAQSKQAAQVAMAPTIARFALSARVLPRITAALSLGERFHQALMAWSRDRDDRPAQVFAGRDDAGDVLKLDHNHAWYLPECNDRGEITHVVVYAPIGFRDEALRAVRRLEKVWGSEGFDIRTDLVSLGQVVEVSKPVAGRLQVTGVGQKWRSLTPLVLPRFPKRDRRGNAKLIPGTGFQVDGPEDQALRLLRQLPHVARALFSDGGERVAIRSSANDDWLGWQDAAGDVVVKVRLAGCGIMDEGREEQRYPWQRFQRERFHGQGQKSLSRGYWLEVWFMKDVGGPIALGYGAHFGLGVLVCADG